MYALARPSPERLEAIAAAAASWPLQTPLDPLREAPERAWHRDRYEIAVPVPAAAAPAEVRAATQRTLASLEFFPDWMIVARRGDVAVVAARCLGLWGVFANRVVEERAESDDARGTFDLRLGYATLAGHFETGVETFRARREGADFPVVFVIEAVSRVDGWWKAVVARLASRRLQCRFGRDATAGFVRALAARMAAISGIPLPGPPAGR